MVEGRQPLKEEPCLHPHHLFVGTGGWALLGPEGSISDASEAKQSSCGANSPDKLRVTPAGGWVRGQAHHPFPQQGRPG